MATVTGRCFEATGRPCIICDFSPPTSGDSAVLSQASLGADFISVAYNPGRSVRANSAMLAAAIKSQTGQDAVFTLATRDMNKLALQSLLLGAQLMGLENVAVVGGDPFPEADLARVKPVNDYSPAALLAGIAAMNRGVDFRGRQLASPTSFCLGATLDLGRDMAKEARLAHRKVRAGTQFFLTQPIFDPAEAKAFQQLYVSAAGERLNVPVFYGLQVLEVGGVVFSNVPEPVQQELAAGRSGVELALELSARFRQAGLHNIYLIPPIRRGGARDYGAARQVLAGIRSK
ncbi:MAG: hypothetical protein FJ316_04890 [SAR202 cluster bacterium]|nr:hypothetical protein [SAR202 cluster bacterium]